MNAHPARRCSPSRTASSLTRSTEPWPIPGPGQERPMRRQVSWLAGRSAMLGLPGLSRPFARSPVAGFREGSPGILLTAYSCRDSLGFGRIAPPSPRSLLSLMTRHRRDPGRPSKRRVHAEPLASSGAFRKPHPARPNRHRLCIRLSPGLSLPARLPSLLRIIDRARALATGERRRLCTAGPPQTCRGESRWHRCIGLPV